MYKKSKTYTSSIDVVRCDMYIICKLELVHLLLLEDSASMIKVEHCHGTHII